MTLAGLPPSVGFVSEWFLLESLMQQFRVPGLGYRLVLALAGASVALTAGFAGVTTGSDSSAVVLPFYVAVLAAFAWLAIVAVSLYRRVA